MNKILFIVPELRAGGAEKTVENLIVYFNKYYPEYKCYQCIMRNDESALPDYVIPLKNDPRNANGFLSKLCGKANQIMEVRRIKREKKIDITVSFLPGADFLNILSGNGKNGKTIISLRNNPAEIKGYSKYSVRHFYKYIVRRADYVVALSQNVMEAAKLEFGIKKTKLGYIYNPAPQLTHLSEPKLITELRKTNQKVLVSAGRLNLQKGQWHLIKAFYLLNKKLPDTRLIILGIGDLEDTLKQLAAKYGVGDKVYFPGFVSNPLEYIKYSDSFVFSSVYEGLGNVLIETLSVGQAIISTDCSFGPREILNDEVGRKDLHSIEKARYGILVPVGLPNIDDVIDDSEEILAEAMYLVLSDDVVRKTMSEQALKRALDFEPKNIMAQWHNLFEKLLEDCNDNN